MEPLYAQLNPSRRALWNIASIKSVLRHGYGSRHGKAKARPRILLGV